MAVLPVTLTVGGSAYDVGTVEALNTEDAQRAKLARFLHALAETLEDGYTLREIPLSADVEDAYRVLFDEFERGPTDGD